MLYTPAKRRKATQQYVGDDTSCPHVNLQPITVSDEKETAVFLSSDEQVLFSSQSFTTHVQLAASPRTHPVSVMISGAT